MMSRNAVWAAQLDRLGVVLHLERGLLRVVDHPEQHGVDVDRDRVAVSVCSAAKLVVMVRWSIQLETRSMNGTTQNSPGPSSPTNRPSRSTTARSHCWAMRGDCITTRPVRTSATNTTMLPVRVKTSQPAAANPTKMAIATTLRRTTGERGSSERRPSTRGIIDSPQ